MQNSLCYKIQHVRIMNLRRVFRPLHEPPVTLAVTGDETPELQRQVDSQNKGFYWCCNPFPQPLAFYSLVIVLSLLKGWVTQTFYQGAAGCSVLYYSVLCYSGLCFTVLSVLFCPVLSPVLSCPFLSGPLSCPVLFYSKLCHSILFYSIYPFLF